jgi:UPF0042 nucleotide-binding protein
MIARTIQSASEAGAGRAEDVRHRLRDPAAARDILDLDGRHPRVPDVVLNTAGAREPIDNLVDYATLPAGPAAIAIGCAGGKHPRAQGAQRRGLPACGASCAVGGG